MTHSKITELPDEELPHEYVGSFNATTGEGESVVFSIEDGSSVFKYCNQDMLRYNPWPAFPAIPSSQPKGNEWMNEDQQFSVILGWTAVWVVGFAVLVLLDVVRKRLRQFFFGEFEVSE